MSGFLSKFGLALPSHKPAPDQPQSQTLPVLLYHRFHPAGASSTWTIAMPAFEQQLESLTAKGYRFYQLQAVIDALRHKRPAIAPPAISLIVDDGHVSVYTLLFPVIRRLGIPVTLFVYPAAMSRFADSLSWSQLGEMVMSGLVDVRYHSMAPPGLEHERNHRAADDFQADAEFELAHWRRRMEQELGVRVDMLAWPYGIQDRERVPLADCREFTAAFAVTANDGQDQSVCAVPRICETMAMESAK